MSDTELKGPGGIVVAAIVALIGTAMLAAGWYMKGKAAEMASWPTVEGKVLGTSIQKKRSQSGSGRNRSTTTMYLPKVSYAYEVGGKKYTNDDISMVSTSSSSRGSAEDKIAEYPKGSTVSVYYDPDDPAESVLETGGGWFGWIFVVLGLLALAGGGAAMVKVIKGT